MLDDDFLVSAGDVLGGPEGAKRHVEDANVDADEESCHSGFQRTTRRGELGVDDVPMGEATFAHVVGQQLQVGESPALGTASVRLREDAIGDGRGGRYGVDIAFGLRIGVGRVGAAAGCGSIGVG